MSVVVKLPTVADTRAHASHASGAKALDLPALQRHAGLVGLLDKILVTRLAVLGDQRIVGVVFLLGHRGRGL